MTTNPTYRLHNGLASVRGGPDAHHPREKGTPSRSRCKREKSSPQSEPPTILRSPVFFSGLHDEQWAENDKEQASFFSCWGAILFCKRMDRKSIIFSNLISFHHPVECHTGQSLLKNDPFGPKGCVQNPSPTLRMACIHAS